MSLGCGDDGVIGGDSALACWLLGPDLRILMLPQAEYPGVSPTGSPHKSMVKEVGGGPSGLPR
jgi:hypothetical protein